MLFNHNLHEIAIFSDVNFFMPLLVNNIARPIISGG